MKNKMSKIKRKKYLKYKGTYYMKNKKLNIEKYIYKSEL